MIAALAFGEARILLFNRFSDAARAFSGGGKPVRKEGNSRMPPRNWSAMIAYRDASCPVMP